MLAINRQVLSYTSADVGKLVTHYVLIADVGKMRVLLSHPNLFLYEQTTSSIQTSNRYSNVISKFYRFMSSQKKFENVDVTKYHVIADNRDIRRWQISRQVERVKKQSDKPKSETIFEDAKIVLQFFSWIIDSNYITSVNVKKRTWIANFKNRSLLNYVRKKAKQKIDYKNIEVLDRESRQKEKFTLITNDEIKTLIQSFDDPVYPAMFKLSLGTAMRPMDLCVFPYIGNGKNKHIMSYSEMSLAKGTVDYFISGSKGNKSRTIKVNVADLKALEEHYIRPFYQERAKKYKVLYGKKCPPSILFLNKFGRPINPSMVSSRAFDAKHKAMDSNPSFREGVTFYDARHWWPTMFMLKFFKDKILTKAADVLYAAVGEVVRNQMGHEEIDTTFRFYIDKARLLALAHEGYVNELVTEPDECVEEFIERTSTPNLKTQSKIEK